MCQVDNDVGEEMYWIEGSVFAMAKIYKIWKNQLVPLQNTINQLKNIAFLFIKAALNMTKLSWRDLRLLLQKIL